MCTIQIQQIQDKPLLFHQLAACTRCIRDTLGHQPRGGAQQLLHVILFENFLACEDIIWICMPVSFWKRSNSKISKLLLKIINCQSPKHTLREQCSLFATCLFSMLFFCICLRPPLIIISCRVQTVPQNRLNESDIQEELINKITNYCTTSN